MVFEDEDPGCPVYPPRTSLKTERHGHEDSSVLSSNIPPAHVIDMKFLKCIRPNQHSVPPLHHLEARLSQPGGSFLGSAPGSFIGL